MPLPDVVSQHEWRAARIALLDKEKEATRARDALNAERRRLPMVRVEQDYRFEAPQGRLSLLDLFGGHPQLIVSHFMFDPEWTDGCPSCSAGADERAPGLYEHLATRNTAFVHVSRARLATIEDYKRRKGWTFPWVLSGRPSAAGVAPASHPVSSGADAGEALGLLGLLLLGRVEARAGQRGRQELLR